MYNVPLVYGNHWDKQILEDCKKQKKLLRVAVAIPGGNRNNECNLKCIFCFTNCGTRHRDAKKMSNEMTLKFIKEASNYAYKKELMNYYFVSEGEPTLNPQLIDVLNETSKLGGTMSIFTNLYELTDEQVKAFGRLKNLFVCGKMYGINEETNDYLTNTKGSLKKMMENIEKLKAEGLAEEGRLGIQCVVTSRNYDEVFDIFKWARSNKIAPHIMMYRTQGLGDRHHELAISQERLLELFEKLSKYDRENGFGEWEAKLPLLVIGDCWVPGVNLYLTDNGDITVCAGDTRSYGNYENTTIKDALNSELFENVIKNHKTCPWVTLYK